MNSWKVHLKWTGVSHEHVVVKADTKKEAEAKIKEQLESNEWGIFDLAWEKIQSNGVIELEDGYDESEVEIVTVKKE
jgi:hypothetical protein